MAYSRASFTLALNGQSLILSAVAENGTARAIYSAADLSAVVTLPMTVTQDTTYYVDLAGRTSAGLLLTLAQLDGTDLSCSVPISDGSVPIVAPVPTVAQMAADLSAGSATLRLASKGITATLKRGQRSTCIAIVGDSTGDGRLVGSPSTLVDEWPQVLTKRLLLDYPTYSLLERKWNDTNQAYDLPIVWTQGAAGVRYAQFSKTTAGSLQYLGTAITGDLDIRAQIAPTTWTPTGDQTILAKWESTGNQRSFLFVLKTTGALGLNWSTAGTSGFGEKDSTATIPATANPGNGNPLWVRATLKLDNGASGNDVKFYYSTDGTAWTQLGSTVTTAGVTTLFGGTAPYQVGSFTSGLSTPFDGKVYWVQAHAGIQTVGSGQTSVVPPLLDDWDWYSPETTVTYGGAPVLMLLNGSISGQNVAYFDNATRRVILHQPHGQGLQFISTSHNDGTQQRQVWITNYSAMVTNIKALIPGVPIVAVGENPTGMGGSFSITAQGIELRAARGALLMQWAASQQGVYGFDAWPLLTSADTIDQLHPTTGSGSGSEKWGLGVNAAFSR
jgi:hypothetical protein